MCNVIELSNQTDWKRITKSCDDEESSKQTVDIEVSERQGRARKAVWNI